MPETIQFPSIDIDAASQEAQSPDMPTFHHVNDLGEPIKLDPEIAEQSERAILGFQENFDVALQEIHSSTETLNTNRVNSFLEDRGIETKQYHVIYPDEFPQIGELYKKNLDEVGLGSLYDARDFDTSENTKKGWHDPLSGQTFIVRSQISERENGAEFTESIIVHELFHAASDHNDMVIAHDDRGEVIKASSARVGLLLPDKEIPFESGRKAPNLFLEEAAASYLEAQYKKKSTPESIKNLRNSMGGVPFEYTRLEGGKVIHQNAYGTAGYAMELMIDARPELLDAVVESRRSAQGLRDVARIINDIKPGLYSALSRIDPVLFHEENLEIVRSAVEVKEDGGHEILRTESNPGGHVEDGFVSHTDRITHRAAVSPEDAKKRRLDAAGQRILKLARK